MSTNNIIFPVRANTDFINELRDKVKEYFEIHKISKYGNMNMVMKSVFMITIYLLPLILMLSGVIVTLPGILCCWVMMGTGMAGVGMSIMHDANHGTYSGNMKINRLLGKSLYLLGGFPVTWKYQHNTLHHGYTNIDGQDEDIDPMGFLRFSPHKPLHKIHKYQYLYAWFFYGLLTLLWITLKDFQQLYKYNRSGAALSGNKSYRQMLTGLILWKIIYYAIFLILPLLILSVPWYWIIVSFLIMHFICGLILGTIFQTAHVVTSTAYPLPDENGNMENNWAIHQLYTTSDFSPESRIFSWLIGGLNYQVEHHLFPNLCHVHYRRIAYIVKNTALKYGLPYLVQQTFLEAVSNHARMLKLLGQKTQHDITNNTSGETSDKQYFSWGKSIYIAT